MSSGLQIWDSSGSIVFDQGYKFFFAMNNITVSGWYQFVPSNSALWRCDIPWVDPLKHFVTEPYITVKHGFLQYYNAYNPLWSPPPSMSINMYRF